MSEPTSLTDIRWKKGSGEPSAHPASEALEIAAHRVKTGEWKAQHIIVIYGYIDDEGVACSGFCQAGSLDPFAQIGLVEGIKKTLTEGS
ncbi:MAG: hypothetical protein NUV75_05770 [Gallionella sp.]|nr:hypothetical protein [Gallionella sp.]